jgi:hypothetical protein
MRRWILNILCATFLVLFLFLLGSWFRSYLPRNSRIELERGRITIVFWERAAVVNSPILEPYNPADTSFIGSELIRRSMRKESEFQWLGFSSTSGKMYGTIKYHFLSIPFWFLLLLTAVVTALLFRARRRHRLRHKLGHCVQCGYDLRESKDTCPECGSPIPAASATLAQ